MSGAPNGPTPQPDPTTWFDDVAIQGDDKLLRVCKTPWQVTYDEGTSLFILSDMIYKALGPGVSVEMCRLYEATGLSAKDRHDASPAAYGAVSIEAAQVRSTVVSGQKGVAPVTFKIAFTPIAANDEDGPNPYHADIYPPTKDSSNKALTRMSLDAVPVDQAKAAVAWTKRHPSVS